MRRTKIAATTAALAMSISLTGCMGDDKSPDPSATPEPVSSLSDVTDATKALADTDRLAMEISLDMPMTVSEALKASAAKEDPQTAKVAEALLDGSYRLELVAPDGIKFSELEGAEVDPWATQFAFTIAAPDKLFDVIYANEKLFASVNMKAISELAGQDLGPMLTGMTAGSPYAGAVEAIVAGKYVSISRSTLETLDDTLDPSGSTDPLEEGLTPEQTEKVVSLLTTAFEDNATVSEGEDGYTRLTIDAQGFFTQVVEESEKDPELAELMDAESLRADLDSGEYADIETLVVDLSISDGIVNEMRMNVLQFADAEDLAELNLKETDELELVVGFDTDFEISVPTDDFPVDSVVTDSMGGAMF